MFQDDFEELPRPIPTVHGPVQWVKDRGPWVIAAVVIVMIVAGFMFR